MSDNQGPAAEQGQVAVQGQWDVSQTSFNSAALLRELIGVASQPDVQPQAILAAENLGFGLVASSVRINDAITALGGNTSMRLESLQASIGMRRNELHRVMRQSVSLLQFFLAITACKPCFIESELGDLAFHMMDQTGVLKRYPVSSSQLMQLIHSFSAQSEDIVPSELMHDLAVAISAQCGNIGLSTRMEPSSLAEMLVRTFQQFVDQSVDEIVIKGHVHGIWIATFFSWLLPDETHVISGETSLRGNPGAKLTVQITNIDNGVWELESFKSDCDVARYVVEVSRDEVSDFHRLPHRLAKHYFDDYYASSIEAISQRQRAVSVMGELARNLVIFFAENGRLFLEKECCKDKAKKCLATTFVHIMSDSGLTKYSKSMSSYGWSTETRNDIERDLADLQKYLGNLRLRDAASPEEAMKLLNETCSSWVTKVTDAACDPSHIVDPSVYLAFDALITSTVEISQGTRYFSPATASDLEKTDDAVSRLIWNGLDVREFRELAFAHLLPGLPASHPQDLVVSYGGYTVGMEVLWNVSTQQRKALAMRYSPGHIEKDGTPLSRIREANFPSYADVSYPASTAVKLFDNGKYTAVSPRTTATSFETRTSIHGDQLMLKHYAKKVSSVQFSTGTKPNDTRQKASWISAMDIIAMATHVGRGNDLTVTQEQELARRLDEDGLCMAWYPGIPLHRMESETKALLTSSGDEKLRFFAASWGYDKYWSHQHCFGVLVRHNAPLLSCIRIAEEQQTAWVIIT